MLKDQKLMMAAIELGEPDTQEARELVWAERVKTCLEFLSKDEQALREAAKSAP